MSEPNFYDYLRNVPAVSALIGSRIYPGKAPQNPTWPALVTQRSGGARQQTHCGTHGLISGSFQFDVYGTTVSSMRAAADAIREAMLDYSGLMGNVRVKHCTLTNDFDSVDPEPGLFRRTQFWEIWYVES